MNDANADWTDETETARSLRAGAETAAWNNSELGRESTPSLRRSMGRERERTESGRVAVRIRQIRVRVVGLLEMRAYRGIPAIPAIRVSSVS